MEQTDSPAATDSSPDASKRWPLFLLGVLLFAAGPLLYFVQFQMAQLWIPWYVPVLASLGVLLMFQSVWKRPGWVRGTILLLFLFVNALEWFLLLVAFKNPAYQGPAQELQPVPQFATTLASGEPFTEHHLADGRRSILVFFRGRW